jgi:hypothetical protein
MKLSREQVEIKIASAAEAEDITKLINSVYRGEDSKKGWTTEADLLGGIRVTSEIIRSMIAKDGSVILTANLNDALGGCVHLEQTGDSCYLGLLSVDVVLQNSGLGKIIIEESEDFARR